MEEKNLIAVGEYITLKQLPVIEDTLAELHTELQDELNVVKSLAPTEENYKELKKVRADWNKKIDVLEKLRKKIKAEIEAPYKQFEKGPYAALITEMRDAVGTLDDGIKDVENVLKTDKKKKLFEYYEQYRQSLGLDANLADARRSNITVGLSDTLKSLKMQAKEYLDRIDGDLKMIDTLEDRDEIYVEYRQRLNVTEAVRIVNERHRMAEEERRRREAEEDARKAREEHEAEVDAAIAQNEAVLSVQQEDEGLSAPVAQIAPEEPETAPEEKIYVTAFRVAGTLGMLKELKAFLENNGYRYESLKGE